MVQVNSQPTKFSLKIWSEVNNIKLWCHFTVDERFQIDIFTKKWTTNTSPASNRLFQEVFYVEVDVFYLWVLLKLFYSSTEHFSMLLYPGLLIINLFSMPAIFPGTCMFFCQSDLSLGMTVIPLPYFAGNPVSACFSSQTISQQTEAMPCASRTLVWFKGSYAALKHWTTIQTSVVLVVIRNQMLCWASISFKSWPQTLINSMKVISNSSPKLGEL